MGLELSVQQRKKLQPPQALSEILAAYNEQVVSEREWAFPNHNIFEDKATYQDRKTYFQRVINEYFIDMPFTQRKIDETRSASELNFGSLNLFISVSTEFLKAKLEWFARNLPELISAINRKRSISPYEEIRDLKTLDWGNVNHFHQFCAVLFENYYLFDRSFILDVFDLIANKLNNQQALKLFMKMFFEKQIQGNSSYSAYFWKLYQRIRYEDSSDITLPIYGPALES